MAFDEDQLLPISALQHFLFCERQCALIHIEQIWTENEFTAEGRVLHERAHDGPGETRPGVRITRGLPVRSLKEGLSGQCDVVEFHKDGAVLPIEYKRGKPKGHRADEVQLCAQGLCLEEMLGVRVEKGALYYGQRRRRTEIVFDETLRRITRETARRTRAVLDSRQTPRAVREKKCESCSLLEACMPDAFRMKRGAAEWFASNVHEIVHNIADASDPS